MVFSDLNIYVPSNDRNVMFWDLFDPVSSELLVEEFYIFMRATVCTTVAI